MHTLDARERRARLVRRHRLAAADRARNTVDAARAVVALHATDAVTVFLSTLARTEGVGPTDVEHSLYEERSLVRLLGMRRTLFVVPRELAPVVFASSTRAIAARERRRLEAAIGESGISTRPGAWLTRASKAALAYVTEHGEASTADVTRAVPMLATKIRLGAGTRWEIEQSAAARVLPQLAMEGVLVRARPRGKWTNPQFRWAPLDAWLGEPLAELASADAQAELVRRWLATFGPGTETDLRWWTGWTAREVRAALAAVPHAEVQLDGGGVGYVLADDLERTRRRAPTAALLPTLDPTTMGWKERAWYLGDHERTLFDRVGNAGPTVWWDGRVVGGWSQRRDGEIVYRLLEDVGRDAVAAIEREAARVAAWLGDVRFSPGFLPPFQRALTTT